MKNYPLDMVTVKLLKEMCLKWQMNEISLLQELVKECYQNSNGGKIRR